MAHNHSLHDHDHAHHGHDHGRSHQSPDAGAHDHGIWTRGHVFLGQGHSSAENRAKWAAIITAIFMVVEAACGLAYHSMALLADAAHMATHVGALGLAAGAYWLARRHAGNARFSFGSGKFGDLAAFASAIILGITALAVLIESLQRIVNPAAVAYGDALLIAAIGLVINLVSAFILKDSHSHGPGHDHGHAHGHDDNNMRAAYVHVLADAATSVLAIAALAAGYYFHLGILDPLAALVGAFVIGSWSYGLIRDSGMVLLDATDPGLSDEIRDFLQTELKARIPDLHLWRLGPGHQGLIVSLITPDAINAEAIKATLRKRYPDLSHVTVEVAVCADCT